MNKSNLKTAYLASIALTILTIVSFGAAMFAVPPTGPYCPGDCIEYPFLNELLDYYPRDYIWMYFTSFQLCAFFIWAITVFYNAAEQKKLTGAIGLGFAGLSTLVLLANYYVQYAVVPASVMNGQTEGIALLTQYNGDGVFIALEELGFMLMSVAFTFFAPLFGISKLGKALRWTLLFPVITTALSFVYYTVAHGHKMDYLFEVAAITINWCATIAIGIMAAIWYKKEYGKQLQK